MSSFPLEAFEYKAGDPFQEKEKDKGKAKNNKETTSLEDIFYKESNGARLNQKIGHESFIEPNENEPQKFIPFWKMSPQGGVYIGPGTERIYTGAANSNSTSLLGLDHDPEVILFNKINLALIKISKTREEYLEARKSSDWTNLLEKIDQENYIKEMNISEAEISLLKDANNESFWERKVVQSENFQSFEKEKGSNQEKNVNYLHSDEKFMKIKKMATDGNIVFLKVDYNHFAYNFFSRIIIDEIFRDQDSMDITSFSQKVQSYKDNFKTEEQKFPRDIDLWISNLTKNQLFQVIDEIIFQFTQSNTQVASFQSLLSKQEILKNLEDSKILDIRTIFNKIKEKNLSISTLDISNAHHENYVGNNFILLFEMVSENFNNDGKKIMILWTSRNLGTYLRSILPLAKSITENAFKGAKNLCSCKKKLWF